MAKLMTLCGKCEKELIDSLFRVKQVPPTVLTTEKKDHCEYCGRKCRQEDLKQYTVTGR